MRSYTRTNSQLSNSDSIRRLAARSALDLDRRRIDASVSLRMCVQPVEKKRGRTEEEEKSGGAT